MPKEITLKIFPHQYNDKALIKQIVAKNLDVRIENINHIEYLKKYNFSIASECLY